MIYRDLMNQCVNAITAQCINIANYNGIPREFKAGYSRSISQARATCWIRIVNPIVHESASIVSEQLTAHLIGNGVNLDEQVDEIKNSNGIVNFFIGFASFVAAKVAIAGGQEHNGRYVIYNKSGVYSSYNKIDNFDCIRAKDGITITDTINKIICGNTRGYTVRYSVSF